MWWWVWVLLVLGALAVAGLLGWRLWRAGMRTLREAGESGRTLSSVAERADALMAASVPADTSPTLFDDPARLRERVAHQRRLQAGRAAERRVRNEATWRRWSVQAWLENRQAQRTAPSDVAPRSRRR